jgi:hypothetical protein
MRCRRCFLFLSVCLFVWCSFFLTQLVLCNVEVTEQELQNVLEGVQCNCVVIYLFVDCLFLLRIFLWLTEKCNWALTHDQTKHSRSISFTCWTSSWRRTAKSSLVAQRPTVRTCLHLAEVGDYSFEFSFIFNSHVYFFETEFIVFFLNIFVCHLGGSTLGDHDFYCPKCKHRYCLNCKVHFCSLGNWFELNFIIIISFFGFIFFVSGFFFFVSIWFSFSFSFSVYIYYIFLLLFYIVWFP